MDPASQLKASLQYEEMLQQQKLLEEYQRLGSQSLQWSDIGQFVLTVLILLLCHQFAWLDTQTLFVLQWVATAYFVVCGIVIAERRKANRRMDVLFRLMQHELAIRARMHSGPQAEFRPQATANSD